jgi:hypothetical protein
VKRQQYRPERFPISVEEVAKREEHADWLRPT